MGETQGIDSSCRKFLSICKIRKQVICFQNKTAGQARLDIPISKGEKKIKGKEGIVGAK